MKDPVTWSREDLNIHLQHAIDLEFWTIPLYLTTLYSIRDIEKKKPQQYPPAAKLILSVVVQEMLHLEIACNLSNALGHHPKFHCPHYGDLRSIPFIHPLKHSLPQHLQDYPVGLGPLDIERLKLFCVIEFPASTENIQWEKQKSYHSIAELYVALQQALPHLWDEYYVGDERNTKQKETFKEYHNTDGRSHGFSQSVNSLATALNAIEAVVEQGEGANETYVPAAFRPHNDVDEALKEDRLSHYQKFKSLLHHHKHLPHVHEPVNKATREQDVLDKLFRQLLAGLDESFNSPGPEMSPGFWDNMYAIRYAISNVWKAGACPQFQLDI